MRIQAYGTRLFLFPFLLLTKNYHNPAMPQDGGILTPRKGSFSHSILKKLLNIS